MLFVEIPKEYSHYCIDYFINPDIDFFQSKIVIKMQVGLCVVGATVLRDLTFFCCFNLQGDM